MSRANCPVIVVCSNNSGAYKRLYLEPNLPKLDTIKTLSVLAITLSPRFLAAIRSLTIPLYKSKNGSPIFLGEICCCKIMLGYIEITSLSTKKCVSFASMYCFFSHECSPPIPIWYLRPLITISSFFNQLGSVSAPLRPRVNSSAITCCKILFSCGVLKVIILGSKYLKVSSDFTSGLFKYLPVILYNSLAITASAI